jgi:hypothetical protein
MHNVFLLQSRIIRIMLRLSPMSSCRDRFQKLDILTVPSLYNLHWSWLLLQIQTKFQANFSTHVIDMRQKIVCIYHQGNFLQFKRVLPIPLYKYFNKLPLNISKLHRDTVSFMTAVRKVFVKDTFYSTDRLLSVNCDVNWHT